MYPYTFYPVQDDEYEQYVRAQQLQRRRLQQQYEQQQYLEYLRHQQYEYEQQQRARAYREYQLREQERQKRVARELEVQRQRQLQAQIEAERRRQQQEAHRRRCQQAAQQRRRLAQQQHEQALREQFVNRHEDGPITLSLFDVLDHIQRQQQRYQNNDDSETVDGESEADSDASLNERLENLTGYDTEPVDAPTVYHDALEGPRVSEPPSPPVELVDDELARAMTAASLEPQQQQQSADTKPKKGDKKSKEAAKEQQKVNHQNNEKNSGILRTLKPRIDLELERFQGIQSRESTDAESAKLKLRNLKQAHLRVEAIYEQLDELRVSRKLRNQKHSLTSTAVQLADKIDDAIAEAQSEASKYPVSSVSTSKASSPVAPASPSTSKHHVTLEDVDE